MSVRCRIPYDCGTFFITFTNSHWLPLFEITQSYDLLFQFFDALRLHGHYVNAYVILPNHVHLIATFSQSDKPIQTIIGTGKRFMGYGIVKRLEEQQNHAVLQKLSSWVTPRDQRKNQKHRVFEPSFDWKYLDSDQIIEQKLSYIHSNPCVCKPALVSDPVLYP